VLLEYFCLESGPCIDWLSSSLPFGVVGPNTDPSTVDSTMDDDDFNDTFDESGFYCMYMKQYHKANDL
jgi:hypothetical protein